MLKKVMFVLFLFLGASLQSQSLNFLTPVDISAASTGATDPQIDFNSSGNGICVWSQTVGANTLILAARTANFGASWDTPKTISTLGANATVPQIAFGTNGNAVCIWKEGSNPAIIKSSKTNDGGITWSTPVVLFSGFTTITSLAFDSFHNMFCVVWQAALGVGTVSSSSSDNGATWSTGVIVDSGIQDGLNLALAFDSAGNGIANYANTVNSNGTYSASKTTDGGITWTTPVIIATSASPSVSIGNKLLSLNMWGTNRAVSVFVIANQNIVLSSSTSDGGLTWSTPVEVSLDTSTRNSRSAFNSSGEGIAIWGNGSDGSIGLSNSANAGLSWATPIAFSVSDNTAQQISMSGSNAIAVWLNTDGANNLVQAIESADSGATWSTPVFISVPGQTALTPQIKVFSNLASNSGPVAVSVWVSNNGGNFTVQSATTFAESPISGFSAFGEQSTVNGLFQKDIVNKISWTSIASAVTYRVYSGNTLLFQGMSPFYQHGLKSGVEYTYSVRWVDALGAENDPLTITLP